MADQERKAGEAEPVEPVETAAASEPNTGPEIAPEPEAPLEDGPDEFRDALDAASAPDRAADPPPADPAPTPPPAARRGGWIAPLAGGALAAVIGFGLSHFNVLNLRAQQDQTALDARLAALDNAVSALRDETAAATEKAAAAAAATEDIATSPAAPPDIPQEITARLDALSGRVEALDKSLAGALAASGDGGVSAAALAALQAEVEALKAAPSGQDVRAIVAEELDARAGAAAEKAAAEAEAAKALALREAALVNLKEAAATGAPYAEALAILDLPSVAPELAAHADTGLPTLPELAAAFPASARAALDASLRASASGGLTDRIWAFLRIQTGARSLSPQEGDDPDAVLSRAEAAVAGGDLPAALDEIARLPAEGQAEMAGWVADARARIAAEAAIAALPAANP